MTAVKSVPIPEVNNREILDAAAKCFMVDGFSGTSIDDIARSIGATKGRIYHHYRSKTDLFFEVFRIGMEMDFQAIEPFINTDDPAAVRFANMIHAHCLSMIETQPYQRCTWDGTQWLLRGSTTPDQRDTLLKLTKLRNDYEDIFKKTALQARDDGDFHFENLSIAIQVIISAAGSPVFWYVPKEGETEADRIDIARQCADLVLSGLTTPINSKIKR